MDLNSREKLLAGIAALSLLGISPQQTFAAQLTTSQAVQQTKKITGNVSDAMGPIIGATVKVTMFANANAMTTVGRRSLEALRLQPLGKPPQCFSFTFAPRNQVRIFG